MRKLQILFILLNSMMIAQECDSLMIKQKNNQSYYKQEYFSYRNPAYMRTYSKCSESTLSLNYLKANNQITLEQKPKQENGFSVKLNSFLLIDRNLSLWGSSSYHKTDKENIKWNNNVDYPLLYPYLVADAKGGNMKEESYFIEGGISKKNNQWAWGSMVNYKAILSSRNKDPRPKNISSNLQAKIGVKYHDFLNSDLGVYYGIKKYTQSTDIIYLSETKHTPIYHLGGLGNFNHLLFGNKTNAYYDGLGYSIGLEISSSKQKDLIFTLDFSDVNIDKIIQLNTNLESSKLKNRKIEANLSKIFKDEYYFVLGYKKIQKNGVESVFSGRNELNEIITINSNYSLENNTYQLNTIYNSKRENLSLSAYINYEIYKEKNYYPQAFQNFDFVNMGVHFSYFYKVNHSNFVNIFPEVQYHRVLNHELLPNFTNIESLNQMVENNYNVLKKNFTKIAVNFKWNHELKNFSPYLSMGYQTIFFAHDLNNALSIESGINF